MILILCLVILCSCLACMVIVGVQHYFVMRALDKEYADILREIDADMMRMRAWNNRAIGIIGRYEE